ncbi:uncharacterized protein LOC131892250 isoform X1 [Tigriopus californicus]|uniref:uncharacterized protein LOC131892250 isoform X1 n=1 Tax=Tigriopus californicus TaxID=6832 RepID=UPI0027D9D74C|nr:uncharacterized protein LOC131892250 isoform X1 [Tigriopus californicus]
MRVSLLLVLTCFWVSPILAKFRNGTLSKEQCPLICPQTCPTTESDNNESRAKSRKKRTVYLPNATFLSLQSRLTVPQSPVGLYLIWIRVRFVVRSLFTEQTSVTGEGFASIFGRSFDNVLTRTLADDQVSILKRIEDGLKNGGLPGRDCVLRTICDLKETPIHEWSLVGEMISTLFFPKSDDHSELADYKEAARVGESETEECWSVYSKCPLSIFNVIPDIYTKDHKFNVSYDNFDAGSTNSFTKDDFADLPKSFPTEDAHKINLDFDFT